MFLAAILFRERNRCFKNLWCENSQKSAAAGKGRHAQFKRNIRWK